MSEEAKTKKVRIYKYASEYNLSADSLLEFLQKKGHDVKSHMSALSDDMIADITAHFKKDIEKAEKHYRKISEFQKKRAEKSEQPSKEEPVKVEVKTVVEEIPKVEEIPPVEEIVVKETHVEEIVHQVEIVAEVEEKEKDRKEIEETPVVLEKPTEETDNPTEQTEILSYQTDMEKEIKQRRGLTIVGKMDLDKGKKKPVVSPDRTKLSKGEETVREGVPAKDLKVKTAAEESELDQSKKKKKKPKAKKKLKVETTEEVVAVPKKKKFKRIEVDGREVDEAIKRTLSSFDDSVVAERASIRKRKKKEKAEIQERKLEEQLADEKKLKVTEFIAVSEIANLMNVPVSDVISKCIGLGIMVSINQRLDVDTITLVADEFGFEVEFQDEYSSEELADTPDTIASLKPRPPVVTIMGHVDHGKTSLLDRIRSTNVVSGEAGGITQHIGAYQVNVQGKFITFLDTPGHEAFTAMRARGAKVTDIVVLVVAADDAVMPQTVEAINHAQAANVPIIIAINKIDKPGANPDKIKQQLGDRNILVEEWGGRYQCIEISAKAGKNIEELLERILLEAEVLELKANPDRKARGTVVESQLDKGRGITGTILVQKGTLEIGDPFVAGVNHGRVRAMFDERNNKVMKASPSAPVMVLGFEGAPQAGDTFVVVESERAAREISIKRQQLKREQDQRQVHHITLDEIAHQISIGGVKELPLIVKGDVDGSVEALSDSLMKLSNEEVIIRVIHTGVGQISEGDVLLASASGAIIIGFHVRPNLNARKLAEAEKVDIRLYNVIYDAINEVKSALEGLLSPVISEEITATVEIRETFKVPKAGTIAGCYVQEGKIQRSNKVRLIRQGIVTWEGELDSLRRFKDDVKEVDAGYECGLNLHNFNDIKVGDIVEAYKFIETKKKLE
ncbi:MAG: translation initiation factor IF-2 [Ignavibacteriales bacterium]|nr:translation initiation factor IF-2 [Ignavibacteriales bacterium]